MSNQSCVIVSKVLFIRAILGFPDILQQIVVM